MVQRVVVAMGNTNATFAIGESELTEFTTWLHNSELSVLKVNSYSAKDSDCSWSVIIVGKGIGRIVVSIRRSLGHLHPLTVVVSRHVLRILCLWNWKADGAILEATINKILVIGGRQLVS